MQLFPITLFLSFLSLKFAKWISDVILMGSCDFEHYHCTAMLNGPLTYNVLSHEYQLLAHAGFGLADQWVPYSHVNLVWGSNS